METTSRQTVSRTATCQRASGRRGTLSASPPWLYGNFMPADIRAATNQAPPLVDHNTVTSDAALVEAVTRHASADVVDDLTELGAVAGSAEAREHGMLANRHEPELAPTTATGTASTRCGSTRRGTG